MRPRHWATRSRRPTSAGSSTPTAAGAASPPRTGGTRRNTASGRSLPPPASAKPATIDEIAKHGHVLTPGRYVGAEEQEDDAEPFAEKYPRLVAELEGCLAEGERLGRLVREQLALVQGAADGE